MQKRLGIHSAGNSLKRASGFLRLLGADSPSPLLEGLPPCSILLALWYPGLHLSEQPGTSPHSWSFLLSFLLLTPGSLPVDPRSWANSGFSHGQRPLHAAGGLLPGALTHELQGRSHYQVLPGALRQTRLSCFKLFLHEDVGQIVYSPCLYCPSDR